MIRHVAEVVLFRLGFLLLPLLSRRAVVKLAKGLGNLGYRFAAKTRRLAHWNLDVVFGNAKSDAEKAALARESFRAFALTMLDLFWFAAFTERRLRRWVRFDASCGPMLPVRPLIVVTGHLGNWELLGQVAALRKPGVVCVAAPLENPWLDALLSRTRSRTGQRIIPRQGAVRGLLRALKDGGTIGLLLDQNTTPREGGAFVDFFGLPAPISLAAATLAMRLDTDIVPGFCIHAGDGSYVCFALDPIPASRAGTAEAVTAGIAQAFETAIRRHPGQWLWMYRRWKYVPPDADRARFPRYARPIRPAEMAAAGDGGVDAAGGNGDRARANAGRNETTRGATP
jgi:KDO2-lipid IV(A) lauroyltransferase